MKLITEQVSHHPPISTIYCETDDFIYEGFIEVISKFKGNSMHVTPRTAYRVLLKRFNEWYWFEKPQTTVMNIIIGKV